MLRELRKKIIHKREYKFLKIFFIFIYKNFYGPLLRGRQDENIEFIFIESKKIIFVLNPKVASRSIIEYFRKNNQKAKVLETTLVQIHKKFPSNIYSYFSIVRDPYSRTSSCYKQKIYDKDEMIEARIFSRFPSLYKITSFERFVDWLCSREGEDRIADRHWKSQTKILYINEECTSPKYKMIGKIEKIDELIKYFAIEYKFSNSIEKILTTDSHKIKNLSEDYQEKIRRRYSKDYKYFNY